MGTGLAFRRMGDDSWSEPKPCSLTALVSPIPDRSQKAVLDMILFVCGGSDKENDDWWNAISCPMGLLVAEDRSQLSKRKNEDPEEDQEDVETILDTVVHSNRPNASDRQFVWRAVNLTSLANSEAYPLVHRNEDADGNSPPPSLYYYCWNKDRLLRESMVSLERIMLMEFKAAQKTDKVPSEDAGRLATLMEHLLRRPNKALAEVIQPEVPTHVSGTSNNVKDPNMTSTEGSETTNEVMLSNQGNPGTDELHDIMTEDLVTEEDAAISPTQTEKIEGDSNVVHDSDETEAKDSFVSDEYC